MQVQRENDLFLTDKVWLSLVSTVHNVVSESEAEVHRVAGNQTHAVVGASYGEMTHCSPLVLFRVVQEHLVSTNIVIATTGYHEPAIVQSHAAESTSCPGQAGYQLPGAAPVLLEDLRGCQVGAATVPATHNINHRAIRAGEKSTSVAASALLQLRQCLGSSVLLVAGHCCPLIKNSSSQCHCLELLNRAGSAGTVV